MMTGVIRPSSGRVLFDGIDLSDFDLDDLRRQIAFITHESYLFRGTLEDNLAAFRDDDSRRRALEIAERLGLDQDIARLPRGYATTIGTDSYEPLPAGYSQRIVIARALANDPRIILFDEGSASLDSEGDARLRDLLEDYNGRCTIVLISHRPSLLRLADRVLRIEDGQLRPLPSATALPFPRRPA